MTENTNLLWYISSTVTFIWRCKTWEKLPCFIPCNSKHSSSVLLSFLPEFYLMWCISTVTKRNTLDPDWEEDRVMLTVLPEKCMTWKLFVSGGHIRSEVSELCRYGADTNKEIMWLPVPKAQQFSLATGHGSNPESCSQAWIEQGGMALSCPRFCMQTLLIFHILIWPTGTIWSSREATPK